MPDTLLPRSVTGLRAPARWSAVAALLCGVHCLLSPLLVGMVPLLATGEATEWWALAGTVGLGSAVALFGPARRRPAVLSVLAAGGTLWSASLAGATAPLPEALTSASGSLIFAGGMLWSGRLCRSGECDICDSTPRPEERLPRRPGA